MTPHAWNETEKHRLLCAWLAGDLAGDDAARLLSAAEADAELRSEMSALLAIERLLRHRGVAGDRELFAEEVIARLRQPVETDRGFTASVIARLRRPAGVLRPRLRWAVAAVLLLGSAIGFGVLSSGGPTLATLTGLEAVRWAPTQRSLRIGKAIGRGTIEIDAGFLRLQFASGATAIVEGPARLDLLGRNLARLMHGRIVADVPDAAKGFTIESPEGRLVDLGTRFGVQVDEAGDTEVHVLQGIVRAAVRGERGTRELHQAEGLRMTPGRVSPIAVDRSRFLTALPPRVAGPLAYVHWSFDEARGNRAGDSGVKLGRGEADAWLTSLSGKGTGPAWVEGRFGSALEFDGDDGFVTTGFRGIAGAQARTVALWVRVPADWTATNAYALVSWGSFHVAGAAWQISINPDAKDGPVGRLRVGVRDASVIGTRDLRDGLWHHIAAVLYDGLEPRDTTHILLYIDGQLEPAYRKSVHEIRTGVDPPEALPVMLGRNLNVNLARQAVFRGTLDEVFVVEAALPQQGIERLMRENRLPTRQEER